MIEMATIRLNLFLIHKQRTDDVLGCVTMKHRIAV
jgi:hypothetical protein